MLRQDIPQIYKQPDVQLLEGFLEERSASKLVKLLDELFRSRKTDHLKRRSSITFGDESVEYTIHFRNGVVHRKTEGWPEWLVPIRELMREWCPDVNVCVVQRYPSGDTGIKPHRDKEMTKGTIICGLSVGHQRSLRMQFGDKQFDYVLTHGSLYLLHPPTNDIWSHCIPTDDSDGVRYSLTFRDYHPQQK